MTRIVACSTEVLGSKSMEFSKWNSATATTAKQLAVAASTSIGTGSIFHRPTPIELLQLNSRQVFADFPRRNFVIRCFCTEILHWSLWTMTTIIQIMPLEVGNSTEMVMKCDGWELLHFTTDSRRRDRRLW